MSLYVPTGTPPIVANALARIERLLPHPGEVLIRMGQRVEPEDLVARAYVPGTPLIINVAQALMIAPADVPHAMRREVGNKVAQGDVLARSGSILGRTCVAPIGGEIASVDHETGYVTISPDPQEYLLYAAVRGIVMEVLPNRGVRIETPAAQVYGVWGLGAERAGVLRLLVTDPSEMITPDMIDARSAYAILIGGSGITAAALRRAVQEQVRGVIVGGIDEHELRQFLGDESFDLWRANTGTWQVPVHPAAQQTELTLVVTEGFGTHTMAAPLFELLAEHDRQEALIEGKTSLRGPLMRPRVVVPLSARGSGTQLEPPRLPMRPGATVRLLDHEHLGAVGRVRSASLTPRRLASGVRTQAVEVELEGGGVVLLPRPMVEVVA
jgi:hypothetical protein